MRHNPFKIYSALIASCICCIAFSGCAVQQLHKDQDQIRTTLLDLYTNQIIDNLIRASNGLPIIQLDYSNATAMVTVTDMEGLSDNAATTANTVTTNGLTSTITNTSTSGTTATMSATPSTVTMAAATVMSAVASTFSAVSTHGIVNTANGTSSHTNANQVALTATPVTTSNDVYDNYLFFLGLGSMPGETRGPSLIVTDKPPPPACAQICKKCGKVYYWVPIEYRKEFFALSLATTAERGNPVPSPIAYQRTVLDVADEPVPAPRGDNRYLIDLTLDHSVPNARGTIGIDGKSIEYRPYTTNNGITPASTKTITLEIHFAQERDPIKNDGTMSWQTPFAAQTPQLFVTAIKTKPPVVTLTIPGHPPSGPTSEDLLNRVNFNLQQIQFNQLRGSNP